ncbi:hypothetical protein BDW74DRAFT_154943 [Aspergillus multicolor]|uniref:uncharacterized protein n=1 Tax=Aspergillus multicolor TaxID=41759 RepID=UPI003CCDE221
MWKCAAEIGWKRLRALPRCAPRSSLHSAHSVVVQNLYPACTRAPTGCETSLSGQQSQFRGIRGLQG